jgi:heat shock protein HtpX
MSVFFVVIIAFGWFFSFYYGNPNILYFFVIFSILMNIFSYWYSDKIVLKLAGAHEAKREEYFDLYTSVENLSITAGLPRPKVYVVEDPAPNAFATGRDKNHAVVCATTGLLAILNKTELEGVIAHELSHVGNRDMLLSTVVVVLVGFVSILITGLSTACFSISITTVASSPKRKLAAAMERNIVFFINTSFVINS